MKKTLKAAAALLLLAALLMGLSGGAQAENARPSRSDLDAIHAAIVYPDEEDYLEEYRYAVIAPAAGTYAARGYYNPRNLDLGSIAFHYDIEVTVIAVHKELSCVIDPATKRAGWVYTAYLGPKGAGVLEAPEVPAGGEYVDFAGLYDEDEIIALRGDGTLAFSNLERRFLPEDIAALRALTEVEALRAGTTSIAAMRKDGSVVCFVASDGYIDPETVKRVKAEEDAISAWNNVQDIVFPLADTVALLRDGSVVQQNRLDGGDFGLTQYPALKWKNVKKLIGGTTGEGGYLLALHSNGTVEVWPSPEAGCWSEGWTRPPENVVDISSSGWLHLCLLAGGTVAAGGTDGQYMREELDEWQDVVQICAGDTKAVGLKADGTVVHTSGFSLEDLDSWEGVMRLYCNSAADVVIGLREDGTLLAFTGGEATEEKRVIETWTDIAAVKIVESKYCFDGVAAWHPDGSIETVGFDLADLK